VANKSKTIDPSDDDRTTAIGLARYAYEYIDAARVIDECDGERNPRNQISSIPAYFLAFHGIELTLKAYLRHKGVALKEIRGKDIGHDLHACYRKAKEHELLNVFKEQQNDKDAMWMLAKLNDYHGLRYIRTGTKPFPLWSIVEPLAVRLHQSVATLVGYKSFTEIYPAYK
jgi:hypothetical protein